MDEKPTVRILMSSPVITITEGATLAEGRRRMEAGRVRHLPVVAPNGLLVGMVSDRDVAPRGRRGMHVGDVMQREVVTIGADHPASEAARLLAQEKIGALPVLDGDRLVGIIASSDFLALAAESLPLRAPAEASP